MSKGPQKIKAFIERLKMSQKSVKGPLRLNKNGHFPQNIVQCSGSSHIWQQKVSKVILLNLFVNRFYTGGSRSLPFLQCFSLLLTFQRCRMIPQFEHFHGNFSPHIFWILNFYWVKKKYTWSHLNFFPLILSFFCLVLEP